MNKKTLILIGAVLLVAFLIYWFNSNKSNSVTVDIGVDSSSPSKSVPTIEELIAKGYEESEARQVQAALAAGTINGY